MKTLLSLLIIFLSIAILSAQENGGPYLSDENTVLLMHFDGDAANTANVGKNGIVHGSGISYESGIHGQCVRLDNSTADKQSWIEIPFYDELNFNEGFSIECWFKINSWGENPQGARVLFRKDGINWPAEYETVFYPESGSGQINLDCVDDETGEWGADAAIADILETDKWYHIVMYYKHAYKHVYCLIRDENYEEVFASSGYSETPPVNSSGRLMIGFGGWSESLFDCSIDEMRISKIYRKYRDDVLKDVDISAFKDSVFLELKDNWTVYQWPLAEYYPINNETGEIFRQNACGPTMLTRTIHYWEYPRFPSGVIEHDMENCHWYADYENTEYLWDLMPKSFDANTTEDIYAPAALFSAQVGTASKKTFDNMNCMPLFLKENFLFSKKTRQLFEDEYTDDEWENIIKNELNCGRPVMVGGVATRSANGGSGHYYIISGYNSKNEFYTDYSFNDMYWKKLSEFDYGISQDIIIYLEPDWGDKKLDLNNPIGALSYKRNSEIEIEWKAENISNLILEYTADGGKNWQSIAENVDATSSSYTWTVPEELSGNYKIRISDSEDLNVYRKTKAFEVYAQKEIDFEYPKLHTKFKKGTRQPIYWNSTGVNAFKLEYSLDGQSWIVLSDSLFSKSGFFMAAFPDLESERVILRATDLEDDEVSCTSDMFNLISEQLWGGPYVADEETLLLMHFENKLTNDAKDQYLPFELNPIGIFEENYNKHLGRGFRIFNPSNQTADAIHVKGAEHIDLGNNWTMEAWVKVASIMGERNAASLIINKWDAFNINAAWKHFGAAVFFENGTDIGFFNNQEYNLNEWYHVAMISDASQQKIHFSVHDQNYENIFSDEQSFPAGSNGMIVQNDYNLTIGGLGGGSNLELDGWLDELRIVKKVVDYDAMVGVLKFEKEDRAQNTFEVYPNPLSAESVVFIHLEKREKVNISIYDIQGRKVLTLFENNLDQGDYTIPIGNTLLIHGIYVCKISTEKGSTAKKLIVQ